MKGINNIKKYVNAKDFKRYLFFSIVLIVTLISLRSLNFTQARYESNVSTEVSPTLAFFVVGVESATGQIKLEGMVPRTEPYLYTFNVSNFSSEGRANVDLTYSIEIITEVDSDTTVTDDNGVYYRHLVINDVSVMNYNQSVTDNYILWVEFPTTYMDYPSDYAGIIDLVDIKINAEQVV